jgi:hypothetical protein
MLTPTLPTAKAPASAQGGDDRLRHVLSIHCDPHGGSAYWLERQATLGLDLRRELRTVDDLHRLPEMTPRDLCHRPLLDFVPRSMHAKRSDWVLAQTGGTTGNPVWTVYSPEEFREAFVDPFVAAARCMRFPRHGTWLYAGPSGPHIIGRAASRLAQSLDGHEPFSVDFDPRWARKLPVGSFGQQRYVAHVVDQALAVIRSQPIDVLFTTPPLLEALAPQMTLAERERIRGVHYGGTHLTAGKLAVFQERWFTSAVHLSGYGNTLFGCCLELDVSRGRTPAYFPHGSRIVFSVVDQQDAGGARRVLRFSRLDDTMLLINVVERDAGDLVEPPPDAPPGFHLKGVRDVRPISGGCAPTTGLY